MSNLIPPILRRASRHASSHLRPSTSRLGCCSSRGQATHAPGSSAPKWDDHHHPPAPPPDAVLHHPNSWDIPDAEYEPTAEVRRRHWEQLAGEEPATSQRAIEAWEREVDQAHEGWQDWHEEGADDWDSHSVSGAPAPPRVDKGKQREVEPAVGLPKRGQAKPEPKPKRAAQPASEAAQAGVQESIDKAIVAGLDKQAVAALRSKKKATTATVANSLIKPFVAAPYDPASGPIQPHHIPLTSRHDWRLSSPLRPPRLRGQQLAPPSLWARTDLSLQGHNKFVGVGVETSRTSRWGSEIKREEPWGWKVKVAENERGAWASADAYRRKLDRLIELSKTADEKSYLELLARAGTPEQREAAGICIARGVGSWHGDALTNAEKIKAAGLLTSQQRDSMSMGGQKVVGVWGQEDGSWIGEAEGYKFTPGMILRFTPNTPDELSSRPQLPPSAAAKHPQGTLLEVRNGQLHVAFEEVDMWALEGTYRIDEGSDDASYKLQARALDHLYFDPDRQRARNADHVLGAQHALAHGAMSTLREWALQGASVRELIVPDLDEQNAALDSLFSTVIADRAPDPEEEFLGRPAQPEPKPIVLEAKCGSKAEEPVWAPKHASDLFKDNQLINSWIKRHQREVPLAMPGDPELGLNASQTRAVAMALGERMSLIQGPPGTGKSATIVSIITLLKRHFRIPQPILLAAPTHVSVDHLLSLLIAAGLNPIRTGRASRVRAELRAWTVEEQRTRHPLWEPTEAAREQSEAARVLYAEWQDKVRKLRGKKPSQRLLAEGPELLENFKSLWRRFISYEHRLHASLLATADVFCSTAIGSGASKIANHVDFPLVFLDEAAMCTEPVSLIPLMKGAQQVCLIGDHKQLPAVIKSKTAKLERLHVSLFERLISTKAARSVLLDTQYRMRPAISAFPNESFYYSQLKDAPTVTNRLPPPLSQYLSPPSSATGQSDANEGDVAGPNCSVFISHDDPEQLFKNSLQNPGEVDVIVDLVGDLLKRNPTLDARDIGIISPYFAQTRLLQEAFQTSAGATLRGKLGPQRAMDLELVEVNTVDAFQGREKSVVILSTVRNNTRGFIGFLTDQRRLNVALTRARDALFVVGNERTLRLASSNEWTQSAVENDPDADQGVWKRYLDWMSTRGAVRLAKGEEHTQRAGAEEEEQQTQV